MPVNIIDRRRAAVQAALAESVQKPAQVELLPFLRARLDEDEHAAERGGSHNTGLYANDNSIYANDNYGCLLVDPSHVLREIEAKRALIELAADATGLDIQVDGEFSVGPRTEPYIGDEMLRTMAAVYSDHPDYQQEWQPTPSANSHGGRSEG